MDRLNENWDDTMQEQKDKGFRGELESAMLHNRNLHKQALAKEERLWKQQGEPFVEDREMVYVKVSRYEVMLVMTHWLKLVNGHNAARQFGSSSSSEFRQDVYALDRCDAYINSGIVTQLEFEGLREAIFYDGWNDPEGNPDDDCHR